MVKDQEYLRSKASYCLDLAKKLGATGSSVTVGHSISETVNFRNNTLDESNRSDGLAISIETYLGKKRSSISSSNLLDDNIKTLIEKCFETTKNTPEDEFNSLPDKELLAKEIKNLNLYDETHFDNEKKIEYLKELESVASSEEKIVNTESSFTENKSNFILANSDGFCNGYKSSSFSASCVTVAKDENSMERDYEFTSKRHLSDIKGAKELGEKASEQTIRKLSPNKIGSEKISIIFDKRIAKGMLGAFAGAISSNAIARGTSFLKDKINEQIFSETINSFGYDDCPGHPVWLEPCEWLGQKDKKYQLHLISNQPKDKLHSQLDHGKFSRSNKVNGREPVFINKKDAIKRNLKDKDLVQVYNDRGSCYASVVIDNNLRSGVILISTGAWYDPIDPSINNSPCKNGNPNTLTPDKGTSSLAQGPIAHTCMVEIRLAEGEIPSVTAYDPPRFI